MLPFLKPKKIASIIVSRTINSEGKQTDIAEQHPKFMKCAEAMLSAIASKDATALADALEALQAIDAKLDEDQE